MKTRYEYDSESKVLIKIPQNELPKQCSKSNPVWTDLENDSPYMRAIFLGQGCWERLDTVSEEKALSLLNEWNVEL